MNKPLRVAWRHLQRYHPRLMAEPEQVVDPLQHFADWAEENGIDDSRKIVRLLKVLVPHLGNGSWKMIDLDAEYAKLQLEGLNDEVVGDYHALAWWYAKTYYPGLIRNEYQDLSQEIELLVLEARQQEITDPGEFLALVGRSFYRARRGIWGTEGHQKFHETDLKPLDPDEDDPDRWWLEARRAAKSAEDGFFSLWVKAFLALEEISLQPELDKAVLSAFLAGYGDDYILKLLGREEVHLAHAAVCQVVLLIRHYWDIDLELPIPKFPYTNGPLSEGEEPEAFKDPRMGIPDKVSVAGMSHEEIMRRFGVSRQSSWRARRRGWLRPAYHLPHLVTTQVKKRGVYHQETVFNLKAHSGRRRARLFVAWRDGIWFEDGALRVHCGICGKPMWFGDATLDHIVPQNHGGGDELGNLQLAHEECNQRKSDTLPTLIAMGFKKEDFAHVIGDE